MIPGERLPNFVLPDPSGQPQMAYALSVGDPLHLVLAAEPSERLVAAVDEGGADRATRRVLVSAVSATEGDHGAVRLVDPGGDLGRHLDCADGEPTLLVFDRNLRLESIARGEDAVVKALARARREADGACDNPDVVTGVQAPVLIVPRVLSPEECASLCDRFEEGAHAESVSHRVGEDGRVELRPDPELKARRDLVLDGQADRDWLGERVARTVLPEIGQAFASSAVGFEWFTVVRYDAGSGWFRRHRDNVTPDAAKRRFAITINLNTGAYRGGNLVFPEYGRAEYAPPAGAALVFSCSLAHEVTEVTVGQRYALLSFLLSE
ncbi:MAG: 2OG-Fe(II) oxygenase [Planctomycetota bacterium]